MTTLEVKCKDDPRAPHGFMRNESHNANRYVCECEFWEPESDLEADARRYRWLAQQFDMGYETYIGESMFSKEELDKYIDNHSSF